MAFCTAFIFSNLDPENTNPQSYGWLFVSFGAIAVKKLVQRTTFSSL